MRKYYSCENLNLPLSKSLNVDGGENHQGKTWEKETQNMLQCGICWQ